MGDGIKYLEGNYTDSNPFTAVKEHWEDAEQAKGLENDEEYMKAFLQAMKAGREENHYLVDGAVLTCTCCTSEPKTPLNESFTAPEGSGRTLLKVTQNRTAKNGAEQYFATVKDCQKFDNIEPFGNCQNPPDREKEKKALMLAETSEELRRLGSCRYMMELSDEWENLLSDTGYEKVTDLNGGLVETITMESILFCKHGGFIYPKESGYIMTDAAAEAVDQREAWVDITKSVADWYLDNVSTYCRMTVDDIMANGGRPSTARGRKGYSCDLEGNLNGRKVYDDCSSFVWACLVQGGHLDSTAEVFVSAAYLPGGDAEAYMQEAGFEWHPSCGMRAEELQEGDILARDGHVEVFSHFDNDGKEWAWTWGSVYHNEPTIKDANKKSILIEYAGVWRLEDAECKD